MNAPKVIAYLLPQFHPIPENDRWWGKGFTEWTNVRKATAKFPGHRQPRVPLEERYYNILDKETRRWQAQLAANHGVSGFCYYHYWFAGKQLLEQPMESLLEDCGTDFPFCIAWANEPWTRTWDGHERDVLMPQDYGGPNDWQLHFEYLLRLFQDKRYIRHDGKPVLLIYRTISIPDCESMIALWRDLAIKAGLPGLHIVSMKTFFEDDLRPGVFDAWTLFEPLYTLRNLQGAARIWERIVNKINRTGWKRFKAGFTGPWTMSYPLVWRLISAREAPPEVYPGAFVDWDNTPRKNMFNSLIMRNVTVGHFANGFKKLYSKASAEQKPFIFINAWNEWAEGTYLEPDTVRGTAYLSAIQSAVERQ